MTCQVDKGRELDSIIRGGEKSLPRTQHNMRCHIYGVAALIDDVHFQVKGGIPLWWVCQAAQQSPKLKGLCSASALRHYLTGTGSLGHLMGEPLLSSERAEWLTSR